MWLVAGLLKARDVFPEGNEQTILDWIMLCASFLSYLLLIVVSAFSYDLYKAMAKRPRQAVSLLATIFVWTHVLLRWEQPPTR